MSSVYIHPSARAMPDAADQLAHLVEAGLDVVLLGDSETDVVDMLPTARRDAELPADPPRGSWFLTADVDTCGERKVGLRTLLIGPRTAQTRPGPRCDVEARDLSSAVLEVLSRDVMG
jgi:hypothetical protein